MLSAVLIFSLLVFVQGKTEFAEEDGVIVMTTSNFDSVISEVDYVLVEFYAPWCGHCKALKPEYERAAELLKIEFPAGNVRLAKVDATVESELATKHGVSGYPTLKLHKNNKWSDFNGDRKADSIVEWLKRKTSTSITLLSTLSEFETFIKASEVAVVGFIKEENTARQTFESVADDMDKIAFGLVTSSEIFESQKIDTDASIVVFKSFDEPSVTYDGDLSSSAITEFVNRESIPLVVEFTHDSAGNVFGSPIRMHLVAFAPKSGDYMNYKNTMISVAKNFKGKAHFIVIDTDLEDHQRILDFFGMTKDDAPSYRMINLAEDMVKYKPDSSDFSETAMAAFVEEVTSGKRKPFLISQEIPTDSDEPVRVLVGKNYNEVSQDESKAVLVELYAPWCGHCQQLAPIWTELGEYFKDRKDVIIAKMDSTANEADGLKVHSFPTLKYYPKGSKEAIEYSGERTLEALKKFIESEGKVDAAEKTTAEEQKDEL